MTRWIKGRKGLILSGFRSSLLTWPVLGAEESHTDGVARIRNMAWLAARLFIPFKRAAATNLGKRLLRRVTDLEQGRASLCLTLELLESWHLIIPRRDTTRWLVKRSSLLLALALLSKNEDMFDLGHELL